MAAHTSAHTFPRRTKKKYPPGRIPVRKRTAEPKPEHSPAQTRQLLQFLACGSAFVLLVAAKLLDPGHAAPLRAKLARAMEKNMDVQAVFSAVGQTFAGERDPASAMENMYQAVFHPDEIAPDHIPQADEIPMETTGTVSETAGTVSETAGTVSETTETASETVGTASVSADNLSEITGPVSNDIDAVPDTIADAVETTADAVETAAIVTQSADVQNLSGDAFPWTAPYRTGAAMETLRESVRVSLTPDADESTPQPDIPTNAPSDSVENTSDTPQNTTQSPDTPSGNASSDTADTDGKIVYTDENLPRQVNMEQVILNFDYMAPVHGILTSGFGYRDHPIEGVTRFHYGVDLAADTGTEIVCFADGTVTAVGESGSYGNYCIITHAGGVSSLYAHCSRVNAVSGTEVHCGDKIAEVGATGAATGPHLHFELHRDGVYLNPIYYVS